MKKTAPTKTDIQKRGLIDALEKSLGVVTTACKTVGIHRSTFYDWYNADAKFREEVDAISDMALDFAETQLHKQIRDGSVPATIFYLKTKGKKRGYIERAELEVNNTAPDFSNLTTDQIVKLLTEDEPTDN
jgi:hypothetical protein